ncbi:MAG: hypothetical protein K0U40_09785 [Betaproteobacteria bacterium]|nr:hypothetical protein [Betaproteobacteria bacterium]
MAEKAKTLTAQRLDTVLTDLHLLATVLHPMYGPKYTLSDQELHSRVVNALKSCCGKLGLDVKKVINQFSAYMCKVG